MLDKVKEMSWGDGHDMATSLHNLGIALVQRLMHKHHGVHYSFPENFKNVRF